VFGRARAATGFSMDLKTLMELSPWDPGTSAGTILAPAEADTDLLAAVSKLRGAGERVVYELPGQKGDAAAQGCERVLKKQNGSWVVDSV
jgi:ATP phosphoribosyltransferase regulatory subunit